MKDNNNENLQNVNQKVLEKLTTKLHGYELYIAGNQKLIEKMNMKPFGLDVKIIDIYEEKNNKFLEALQTIDGLAYGSHCLAMPKWVMLDCGLIPGAFIGLGKKYSDLSLAMKQKINPHNKEYSPEEFIPISEFCAIPQYGSLNEFVAHTLACIDTGKNLGLWTKILGLEIYGAKKIIGIAQYNNNSLKTHTKISKLKVLAPQAFHEDPETFIYEAYYNHEKIKSIIKRNYVEECIDELLNEEKAFLFDYEKDDKSKLLGKYIIAPGQLIKDNKIYIPVLNS